MSKSIQLELTVDEALVLFEFLARCEDDKTLSFHDRAEERVLSYLHGLLEKQLVEIFDPAYRSLVQAARNRLSDPE